MVSRTIAGGDNTKPVRAFRRRQPHIGCPALSRGVGGDLPAEFLNHPCERNARTRVCVDYAKRAAHCRRVSSAEDVCRYLSLERVARVRGVFSAARLYWLCAARLEDCA